MSAEIRVGIIGCGGRLRGLAHYLEKVAPRVRVVMLADPSAESIRMTRELFGREIPAVADHRELCASPTVDWVMVGSWNCLHREHAVAAMEAGKDVFCEKPLATSLDDCLAIREARDRTGRKLYMGFTLRHSPHCRRVRDLVTSGRIGKLLSFEFNETLDFNHGGFIHRDWRRLTANAGTHLLEKCCHDIDLAIWMVGSLPLRVAGFGGRDFFVPENVKHMTRIGPSPDGKEAFCSWPRPGNIAEPFTCDKDILDNQVAIMQFANGVRATFHANSVAGIPERRMYLLGDEGALRGDVLTGRIETRRIGWERVTEVHENPGGGHGGGDHVMCLELAAAMLDDAPIKATLENGLLSAITCFAIDQATATNTVVDVAPWWCQAGIDIA